MWRLFSRADLINTEIGILYNSFLSEIWKMIRFYLPKLFSPRSLSRWPTTSSRKESRQIPWKWPTESKSKLETKWQIRWLLWWRSLRISSSSESKWCANKLLRLWMRIPPQSKPSLTTQEWLRKTCCGFRICIIRLMLIRLNSNENAQKLISKSKDKIF